MALAGLVVLWAMTAYELAGPHPLQGRIPTHFDMAGNPNRLAKSAGYVADCLDSVQDDAVCDGRPEHARPMSILVVQVVVLGTIGWYIAAMRRLAEKNFRRGRF